LWGHEFRAFGFPTGFDNGVWASGRILDRDANDWLQVEDTKNTGYFVQPGFSGGPLWDEHEGAVVGMIVAADSRAGVRVAFGLPVSALEAAWPILGQQALPSNPYRGLFAFREADAALFFGREAFTDKLFEAVGRKTLVAVVGPSGCGKSSVVYAGLIPKLKATQRCPHYRPCREPG
jgi:S1-C subfamily serine protease